MIKNKKNLGQHYLYDQFVIDNIISMIMPRKKDFFIEIGAGKGALTSQLCKYAKKVIVIEFDKDLVFILKKIQKKHKNLIIINNDILKIKIDKLIKNDSKIRIVGNLPYNISKKIILNLIKNYKLIKDINFMIQKEVAERLTAKPSTKKYGKMSIFTQYHFKIIKLLEVAPSAFIPTPKVHSNVIKLYPYKREINTNCWKKFKDIVDLAFHSRRKILSNSLKKYISNEQMKLLNIPIKSRAEEVDINTYCKISNMI